MQFTVLIESRRKTIWSCLKRYLMQKKMLTKINISSCPNSQQNINRKKYLQFEKVHRWKTYGWPYSQWKNIECLIPKMSSNKARRFVPTLFISHWSRILGQSNSANKRNKKHNKWKKKPTLLLFADDVTVYLENPKIYKKKKKKKK